MQKTNFQIALASDNFIVLYRHSFFEMLRLVSNGRSGEASLQRSPPTNVGFGPTPQASGLGGVECG